MNIFALALLLASPSAFASPMYARFTGHFTVDAANCSAQFAVSRSVDISLVMKNGLNQILFVGTETTPHGDHTTQMLLTEGQGAVRMPGTTIERDGNATITWLTVIHGQTLVSSEVRACPGRCPTLPARSNSKVTLELTQAGMVIESSVSNSRGQTYQSSCRLIRK